MTVRLFGCDLETLQDLVMIFDIKAYQSYIGYRQLVIDYQTMMPYALPVKCGVPPDMQLTCHDLPVKSGPAPRAHEPKLMSSSRIFRRVTKHRVYHFFAANLNRDGNQTTR